MIPFKEGVKSLNKIADYKEHRDLIHDLLHAVVPQQVTRLMRQIDDNMQGRPASNFPEVTQAVLPFSLPFVLGISTNRQSLALLFKAALVERPVMKDALRYFAAAHGMKEAGAVVLWRPTDLSTWVIHNLEMPKAPLARIVVPATVRGFHDITICPLDTWAEDFKLQGGVEGNV